MYYGKFHEVDPASVKAIGYLQTFLERQNDALSSHYKEQGFPFDTAMWDGGVGRTIPASIVYNDDAAETPSQEAWWPYEQSAYLLDGLLRLGILNNDREKLSLFEKNLKYVLAHPSDDGLLGHCYKGSNSEWPMAVFARAVVVYCEWTKDRKVKEAFVRHYASLSTEQLAIGFRHINNLEGLLKAYTWSDNPELLQKAQNAYKKHDEYYSLHTEDEFELFWSKITSRHNYVIHGVSFSESIKLPVLLYLHTGKTEFLEGAEAGLARVLATHEQIPGLPSCNEDFAGRDPLQGYETCVVNDFAWALGYFLMATGNGKYADRMEKIFYNAFPGSLLKDFTALQYLSAPNQVIAGPGSNHSFFYRGCATFRQFRADHSAQCCTGNVHRILPNFILRMWMNDSQNAPVATLYGPSVHQGNYNGIDYSIQEETSYPFDETITFRFSMRKSVQMPFTFRIPECCKQAHLSINGKTIPLPKSNKGFCTIKREWQNGDTLELILPMTPIRKKDKYWSWYEFGALVFSLPVPYSITRENPSRFAPCIVMPEGKWNYGIADDAQVQVIRKKTDSFVLDDPPIKLLIEALPITSFDELELGRYTPKIPIFHHIAGTKKTMELVPYGSTLLRITAFPDTAERHALNCHQVLVSPSYPYDFRKAQDEQHFLPEFLKAKEVLKFSKEIVPERSGYCDLLKFFANKEHALAYVLFRFYSDQERDAYFAISASDGAESFFDDKMICRIEPMSDAEYIAPEILPVHLKTGYNILMMKAVEGPTPLQYRKAWGVLAQAFY